MAPSFADLLKRLNSADTGKINASDSACATSPAPMNQISENSVETKINPNEK
jgi:hypothetical protein